MQTRIAALVLAIGLATQASAGNPYSDLYGWSPSYEANTVDDVRRPGFNGRLFVRRPVIGGVDAWAWDSGNPGADYYGAYGTQDLTVGFEVEPIAPFNGSDYGVINPWQAANDRTDRRNPYSNAFTRARDKADDRLEEARQEWLRDNNLTGGVRTHVNDAALFGPGEGVKQSALPTPRATIQLPADAPRIKRNIRVQGPARISVPPTASSDLAARIQANGGTLRSPDSEVIRVAARD